MAKITPRIRTVLLFILLIGSYLNTHAHSRPLFLNILDTEYVYAYNYITEHPYYFKSSREKQTHNIQKPFDFSIEKKISQIFGLYNLNTSFKKSDYGKSLRNFSLLNSLRLPINKSAGHSITLDSKTNVSCSGGNDGAIEISISGGIGAYTYLWSGNGRNEGSQNISNLTAGTYSVTVTDSDSSVSSTFTVSEPVVLSATVANTQPSCYGTNNGSITITSPAGGYGTYQYSINGGSTWTAGLTNTNLAPNTYNVQIRDAANTACVIDLGNQVITYPVLLSATVANTQPSCYGTNNGSITITSPAGGYGTYQYSINGGSTWTAGLTNTNLAPNTYNVQIRDAANTACVIDLGNQVITYPIVLSATVTNTQPSCYGTDNGSITITSPAGGYGTYQYSINGGSTWNAGLTNTNLAPDTYNVQIRDAANTACVIDLGNQVITYPVLLSATVTNTQPSCYGTDNGSITITSPAGGYGTYQYSINGGSTWNAGLTNTNLAPDTYNVQIRDAANTACVIDLGNQVITYPVLLSATVTNTQPSCYGTDNGSITISSPAGGYGTYQYSINGGSTWNAGLTNTNLAPDTYNVQIRDAANTACVIDLGNQVITYPFPLLADISYSNVSCNGANDGSIIMTGPSGGYGTFEYSIGGIDWQATGSFLNLPKNTYSVQIRDKAHPGCVIILDSTLEITQPEILTSSLVSQDNVKCKGFATGAATINASGGTAPYTYSWGAFGTGATKTDLPAGTYSIIVTDDNGCKTLPLEVVITEPNSFVEIVNIVTTSGCYQQNNGTATAEVQGGTGNYSYLWSNGQTSQTATGLAPGNYSVTVKDENFCETQKSIIITAPAELLITGFHTTETTSFGTATGTATVNLSGGTPGYTFLWSNGQTGQTAKDLVAGTYDVTVTDANGCKTAKEIVKIYNSLYTEIKASAICATKNDEIRTSYFEAINIKGGSGNYTFSWTFGDDRTGTGSGQHIVKYDSSGQKTIILILTDIDPDRRKPDGNMFTYTSSIIIYAGECFGKCGSEDLRTGEVYIGNETGSPYNVDQNCELVTNEALWIDITEPGNSSRYNFYTEYVVLLYHPDGTVTEYSSIGQCSLGLIDGNKPLKITSIDYKCGDRISVEKFFMSVSSNQNGGCNSYTDGPKCNANDKPITVVTPLSAVAKDGEILCYGASNGKIIATASGGKGKYQYTIKSTTSTFIFTSEFQTGGQYIFENLKADTYNVIIKDEAGRTYTIPNVKIIQPSNPLQLTEESRTPLTCNGGNNAEVTVNASGGTAPYTYVWKNGQTTKSAINLSTGPNEVKVIDKNGCEVALIIDIIQPPIIIANAGPDQTLNCGVTQVKLSAVFNPYMNPATGVEEFGEWIFVNGPVGSNFAEINNPESLFTIQTPGTYTIRWTVPCGATDDVKITNSYCSTIDFDGINDHIDFGDNFNPAGDFTFEAWIKQNTNATGGTKTILSKRDLSSLSNGFDLIIDDGILKFRWNNSEIIASDAIGKDRWYHLAIISNSSGTKIYVDGIDVGNGATAVPVANNFKFLIGAMYNSGADLEPKNYFHGWIEEVRIWTTALTEEQLRFMMNQRIKANNSNVRGVEIPLDVPGNLVWNRLDGYYQMEKVANGFTLGETSSTIKGKLINITTNQERTAPLPYISAKAGLWFDDTTWLHPQVWDFPNSKGINNDTINWNIARVSHNINSGEKDIKVLGLLSKTAKLTIAKPGTTLDEKNSGQSLTISHYLELNGNIDLVGESQLLQTEGSVLEETSSGFIERDQQGTANSYNYNYWSSPVSLQGPTNNSGYTIGSVMLDGTNTANPLGLSFGGWHEYADGAYGIPRKISNSWLYKFMGTSNVYSEWKHVGSTGPLKSGEGYTMKGTSGGAEISDRQNYVFKGKPNNGNITLTIGQDQNYLLGNPYPSALDADQFIKDNLMDGGTNTAGNVFNGALYFWDHFAGKTHILADYIGGYATYNLSGGVPAVATDERINNTGQSSREYFGDEAKIPQRYIPVAQGFFINTVLDPILSPTITVVGGEVNFKNSQRAFIKETTPGNSQFLRPETNSKKEKQADSPSKIRLDFKSPMGYNRQILVGADPNTTNGFDLGYDAPLYDNNPEDMFWLIDNIEFVIQGVPDFGIDQVLPLGIKIKEAGVFSIKINKLENVADDVNIYLKNLQDSTYFDLRKGDYSMNLEPGHYNKHFQIVFQDEKVYTEEPDPNEETEEKTDGGSGEEEFADGNIEVFYVGNNRELAILNPAKFKIQRVIIYDLLGAKIQEYQYVSSEEEVRLPVRELAASVYVVKLYSENKEISKSIILIR